jgi:membrane-bound lytic murein transglycosylase D
VNALRLTLAVLLLNACAQAPQAPESPAAAPEPVPQEIAATPPAPPPFEARIEEIKDRLRALPRIDRTARVDDLWQRIRYGFAMPDLDNALVREKTRYYAARPDYLQRIFDRSRLYLYHIVEEIERRGLPTELALLPMVESAFNPMAYSRAHASGLWQFIPGTGRRFELEQNWWYDGRRDIVESTNAALDYLEKLYEMHGDWHLALASYNWGENAVARAIAKNQAAGLPGDYASLSMPAETRQYIPKLQALKNIIADPEPFGIDIGPISGRSRTSPTSPPSPSCATSTCSSPRASPRCRSTSSSRSTPASAARSSAPRSRRASCCRRTRSTCSTTTSRPWATSRSSPGRPTTRSRARPSNPSPRSTACRSGSSRK